jgi:hypothetical protein
MYTDESDLTAIELLAAELTEAFADALREHASPGEAQRVLKRYLTGDARIDQKLVGHAEVVYALKALCAWPRPGRTQMSGAPNQN